MVIQYLTSDTFQLIVDKDNMMDVSTDFWLANFQITIVKGL